LDRENWKLHKSLKVTKSYQTTFFGRLELFLKNKPIRIKARGKWLRNQKKDFNRVKYSEFVTNHTKLNCEKQSEFSFPGIIVNKVKEASIQFTFIIPSEVICLYNKYSFIIYYYIVAQKDEDMICPIEKKITGKKIKKKKYVETFYTKENDYCNNNVDYERIEVTNLTENTKYNLFAYYKIDKDKPKQSLVSCEYFQTSIKSENIRSILILVSTCILLFYLVMVIMCFLQKLYKKSRIDFDAQKSIYSKYSEILMKSEKYLNSLTLNEETFSKIHITSFYQDRNKMMDLLTQKRIICTKKFENSICNSVQSTKLFLEAKQLDDCVENYQLTGSKTTANGVYYSSLDDAFTLKDCQEKDTRKPILDENYISKNSFNIYFKN